MAIPARPSKDFRSLTKKGPSRRPARLVLIGQEGVGKTTAGAQCPAPVFICAEDGLIGEQFEALDVESYSPTDWLDMMDYVEWLRTGEHDRQSLIVDTADWVEQICWKYICARDSVGGKSYNSIEDYGFGKGFQIAAEEFRRFLQKLEQLQAERSMMVMILCHSTVRSFKNPEGPDYERFEGKLEKKSMGLVKEWADAVVFARFETFTKVDEKSKRTKAFGGQVRVLECNHSAAWDAKNRFGLPDGLLFDMPALLEAIKNGPRASNDPAQMAEEIRALAAPLPEDKLERIEAAIADAGDDPSKLAHVLNRVRYTLTTITTTQEN